MVRVCVRGIVLLAAVAATGAALAGGYRASRPASEGVSGGHVKDCTRINSRYGYYGNPWCTPQEQARFDRWSAQRRWVR